MTSVLPLLALMAPADVGTPTALIVQPAAVTLAGPRSMQQLVVTGRYADGTERDLTTTCEWQPEAPGIIEVRPHGFLLPRRDGSTGVTVRAGGQTARLAVAVRDYTKSQPVSFRREMMGALSVSGCN